MTTEIGTRFEKYVQQVLEENGLKVERNLMYHRGKKKRQVDLEYMVRERLFFRKKVIVECKYVGDNSSLSFDEAFEQLASLVLFTKGDEGLLATNTKVKDKDEKAKEYNIRIYDIYDFLKFKYVMGWAIGRKKWIEQNIRSMPYDPEKDHLLIHRYL